MKHNIILAALIFITATAFADAPERLTIVRGQQPDIFKLVYHTGDTKNVRVSIYNEQRECIFSEILKNVNSFVRPYNFGELAEGNYQIVTESDNGKSAATISHIREHAKSKIEVVKMVHEGRKFRVKITSPGEETATVRIYNNRSELLHEEVVFIDGKYDSIYNLEAIPSFPGAIILFEIETASGQIETSMF